MTGHAADLHDPNAFERISMERRLELYDGATPTNNDEKAYIIADRVDDATGKAGHEECYMDAIVDGLTEIETRMMRADVPRIGPDPKIIQAMVDNLDELYTEFLAEHGEEAGLTQDGNKLLMEVLNARKSLSDAAFELLNANASLAVFEANNFLSLLETAEGGAS